MKIAVIAPLSISVVRGGVRTQVLETAAHLRKLGVSVDMLSPAEFVSPADYDVIHLFSASAETSNMASLIKGAAKFVVTPVFFSNRSPFIIRNSIRFEKTLRILGSGIRSDFTIKSGICTLADKVLPNTSEELALIRDGFGVPAERLRIIPNGVDPRFADAKPDLFVERYRFSDFVLFAGQAAAPRKNVLGLLKIAHKLNRKLVIIGTFSSDDYGRECLKIAENSRDILLLDTMNNNSDLLASAYAACSVFVLPSWYETPGIAAMEAALAGANIAITTFGGTKEYFMDFAEYLNPAAADSISNAIKKAAELPHNGKLKARILKNYTWQTVAENTYSVYKELTGK